MEDFEKQCFDEKEGFQSLYFMELKISEEKLEKAAHEILEDSKCGDVFRIKGFVKLAEQVDTSCDEEAKTPLAFLTMEPSGWSSTPPARNFP